MMAPQLRQISGVTGTIPSPCSALPAVMQPPASSSSMKIPKSSHNLTIQIMNSILSIRQLSHKYTSTWAISDINMEIAQNGITGLLGSNGAGKSTTMNIICGVLSQTEGNVCINGIDIRKSPEAARREVGFLPQATPLYLDLTIDEYLTYCAELRLME